MPIKRKPATRRKARSKRAVGRKVSARSKTGTRKKVSSTRAVLRIPPKPANAGSHEAWNRWTDAVLAMPVRFTGQPAYVRDIWNSMADGFGKVSASGEVVTMSSDYDGWLWREYPHDLKGRKSVSIRLLEDGKVVAMRAPTRNPARRKAPKRRRASR
jgi:hypothetical protein